MPRTHQELDARLLELHRLVAEKIRRDPALLDRVRATITRWRPTMADSSMPYLEEWDRLLAQGIDACLAVAIEDSERGAALRQSSPFTGILTRQERYRFFKDWERLHDSRRA